jgi:hypothetical protein
VVQQWRRWMVARRWERACTGCGCLLLGLTGLKVLRYCKWCLLLAFISTV